MAIIQGPVAKGNQAVAYPSAAGETCTNRFEITVPTTALVNDILEIGSLPPGCIVADMTLVTDALGGTAAGDVGIMSGAPGSTDPARTCGNEFFAAAALAAAVATRMSKPQGFRITPSSVERSIGLKVTAVAASAGKVGLTVLLAAGT